MWRAAPKNTMADSMYDPTWVHLSDEERTKRLADTSFCLGAENEVVFDAADFSRTGKHVFGQISMTTNMQGELFPRSCFCDGITVMQLICWHYMHAITNT